MYQIYFYPAKIRSISHRMESCKACREIVMEYLFIFAKFFQIPV